jgi:tetratricopeptide (TPR) repeat protein
VSFLLRLFGLLLLALPVALAQEATPSPSTAELEAIGRMIEKGERAAAEERLRSAARRFESVRALVLLARLQSERQDLAAAVESLEQARRIAPNSEEVLAKLAKALRASGEVLPAIEVLDGLTRLCPTVAEYSHAMGTALMQVGDTAAAVESLTQAARLEPDNVPTQIALGMALNARGRYPEARPHLLRAMSLAPESVDAVAALAEAEDGLGELEAAEAHAERALARDSAHPRANLVMGMVRLEQGRYPGARDALLKAVAEGPDSAKAQYQLSQVYARLGDAAGSQKHLELYRRRMRETEERVEEVRRVTGFSPSGMEP